MSNEVFLYSEDTENGSTNEVTAEELNNIAIDLGCAEFADGPNAFVDGHEYTVDALNRITSSLVSAGVLLIGNRCAVSWDAVNKKILIKDGVCVFNSGAKLRIHPDETLRLDGIEDGTNYVYALYNPNANTVKVISSLSEPDAASDFVYLAEIDADKNVIDKRQYAKTNCIIKSDTSLDTVITEKFHFCGKVLEKTVACNSGANMVCYEKTIHDTGYGGLDPSQFDQPIRYAFKMTDDNGEPLPEGVTVCMSYLLFGRYNKEYRSYFMNFKKVEEGVKITYWNGYFDRKTLYTNHEGCSYNNDCSYPGDTLSLELKFL